MKDRVKWLKENPALVKAVERMARVKVVFEEEAPAPKAEKA